MQAHSATAAELDHLLGLTTTLLTERGQTHAAALLPDTTLSLELDGGIYYPNENDNWNENTYRAVLHIPRGSYAYDKHIRTAIWSVLEGLLERHDCREVQELVFQEQLDPLPEVPADWRTRGAQSRSTNQARRSRAGRANQDNSTDEPTYRGLAFDSRIEIAVFQMLERLQRDLDETATIAIAALPAVQLRAVPTYLCPDLLVIGNGRAVIVEVDSPYHRSHRRRVDDDDRNRHWTRCGVRCIRVAAENISTAPNEVETVLREDLVRELGIRHTTPTVRTR